jgi:gliding-associated putative ABC transporter substrate-binding component GldG
MKTASKNNLKQLGITLAVLVLLNFVGTKVFGRFDLTQDKRYTLSQASRDIAKQAATPLEVKVLLAGNFTGEFKKLQTETNQMLEEYRAQNSNIKFTFVNPFDEDFTDAEKKELIYDIFRINYPVATEKEEKEIRASIAQTKDLDKALDEMFIRNDFRAANITVNDKGKQTQQVVMPWAIASYKTRATKIPLLKNMMGAEVDDNIVSSVQHLEYAFSNAFNIVTKVKQKRIAIIKGNGELADLPWYIGDFLKSAKENYFIAPFPLDSIYSNPTAATSFLKNRIDLAIIAKPTKKFSDEQKEVLDQFIMNGGKTIWLIDQVNMEMDSLYNTGTGLAFPNDLNLNDMFFKYGVRIHPDLIKDLMATPIKLATGEPGSSTQLMQYPWFYSPMIYPAGKHPVVSNLDGIKFEYANGIELLNNDIKKTVLLQSSPYSKALGTPLPIDLRMVNEQLTPSDFKGTGNIPVAVLLEGKFKSVFQNRVLPFPDKTFMPLGKDNKMIVISDGDVIKNQLKRNGEPAELGFDQSTGKLYANKEFMMNCVNFLLDDNGLINIRSKQVSLPVLDKQRVVEKYTQTQILMVGLPIALLGIFGLLFTFIRRKTYAR